MNKKRETIAEMRQKIEDMITASKRRQKGKDVTSEDIRKRRERKQSGQTKPGNIAESKSSVEGGRAQSESGYTMPKEEKAKAQQPKKESKPRQRPGAGREAMMAKMEEERKRRQRGESAVVGSD